MASIGSGSRVRVVARIRGPSESVSGSKPWILVSRPDPNSSSRVKISFSSDNITSVKQSYEVDDCYEQAVGNEELFMKEIKPMISGLFGGQNGTVFAFGTRGSGKTYTIQGCEEEVGVASLAMNSILPQAEEEGKVVNISVFEVSQDRITDLIDSKRSEVFVFEDAQGEIRLKGLSKVKVNSTEEFQKLYHNALNTRMQKASEPPHRSHIGCVLHVVSPQTENSRAKLVGKISFIDLASYEDSRRMSSDGLNLTETTRIKKSLNAVHNVLYALNAKDRVPYRESKLTRMLQDSLGGSSRILMVTCINPSFSQETVQTISVASRSCIAGFLSNLDPSKSGRSGGKKTSRVSSPQIMKSASKLPTRTNLMSPKVMKPMSASATKKHTPHLSVQKASGGIAVQKKGRKLFVDTNQGKSPKQDNVCPVAATSADSSAQTEANTCTESDVTVDSSTQLQEKCSMDAHSETDSSQLLSEKETLDASSDVNSSQLLLEEDVIKAENVSATPCAYKTPTTGSFLIEDKENKLNDGRSPPLSARLRDLSNHLKSLHISTEANLKMTQDSSKLFNQAIQEVEPKTPTFQSSARASERYGKSNNGSPWTGIKDSLIQESLKYLNSANKEELKRLKFIGEKRATYILELRDESPEPFKELDDLKDIGLSEKQIKGMMTNVAGNLFS
ncbi:hypothetical protein RND81_05G089200 [Saponaria officinalis]|uniref:Kinesin motor domain-containing protein n=1 Tax=Saponaria officinalis TaxID=3572 RepID=A0AAW1KR61_SAPOF